MMKRTPWSTGKNRPTIPKAISNQPMTSTIIRLICRFIDADNTFSVPGPPNVDAVVHSEGFEELGEIARRTAILSKTFGQVDQLTIPEKTGESKTCRTPLPDAREFTGSAELEVCFGDFKAVIGAAQHLQPTPRILAKSLIRHQNAPCLAFSPADPATKLMKLRKTESLRRLDDHHRRLRHIHANLYDRGCKQNLYRAIPKAGNRLLAFRPIESAVEHLHSNSRQGLTDPHLVLCQRGGLDLIADVDDRVDHEHPASGRNFLAEEFDDLWSRILRT